MTDNPRCRTVLLSDLPTENDRFGSHKSVAEAIADLVSAEDGGRAIALTGAWGSGKSSVVKLLAKCLLNGSARPGTAQQVISFDAWSHQGDPLRRSFLEWMLAEMEGLKWIDGNQDRWKHLKESLSKRKTEQWVQTTPGLTRLGYVVAFLYMLAPAAIALFAKIGDFINVEGQDPGGWLIYLPWIALAVLFSPLIVVLGAAFHAWATQKPASGVLSVLINKSTETTTSTSIQTPEPTSIEFQRHFHSVLEESLRDTSRKLVLVIDNLDRMCAQESLSIWASMRTFFDMPYGMTPEWMKRFWLLVPYDHGSFVRLWERDGGTGARAMGSDIAESFLEKTFQVRFHVPVPVVSDWHSFLDEALATALPGHEPEQRHAVYSLYRAYRLIRPQENMSVSPTPRDIKMFVNDLGAVHRQWCCKGVELTDQALYVLMVRSGASIDEAIRDFKDRILGDPRVACLLSADPKRNLAAMLFNVCPDKAYQVLLSEDVEMHLTSGDGEALQKLTRYGGLSEVCEHVVSENVHDWAKNTQRNLTSAAAALARVRGDIGESPSWDGAKKRLCSAAAEVAGWDVGDPMVVDGLISLMQMDASPSLAKTLMKAACNLAASQLTEEDK